MRMIQIWPRLENERPGLKLVLIGDGPDRPRLEAQASQVGANTHFLGRVDDAVRDRYLRHCMCFCMPSRREGFGLVYLEAMRLGKPVLGGSSDGAAEVIIDGVTGRTVDPTNTEKLLAALLDVSGPNAPAYGAAGRARFLEHFTYEQFRDRFSAEVIAMLGGPAPRERTCLMCGIAGSIGLDRDTTVDGIGKATEAQRHRGPDDTGITVLPFGNAFLGLGHTRLSILDLSAAGHQPMCHPRTGDKLVYNGEIYNFALLRRELEEAGDTFHGHSDTEVLLHALSRWGPSCLSRVEGMFAFAFLDVAGRCLILARDPAGIKPLYLARSGDTLLFASEVRALLASGLVPPRVDPRGVAGLLAYGAVQHPCTLFRDIWSLPPGSSLEITADADGGWTMGPPKRFWRYPRPNLQLSETEAVERIAATFDSAVRDHLVSDVPVGVFLSSGLDSSVVAGAAARHARDLHSFTVGFAEHPDLSEEHLAAETARGLGLTHVAITLSHNEIETAAREWLEVLDQPSMDGLNVFVISRTVRQFGIKVALSGQGGDELFGGYPSFRNVPRICRMMSAMKRVPTPLRRGLAGLAGVGRSTAYRHKLGDMFGSNGSLLSIALQRRRVLSDGQLAALGVAAAPLGLTPDFLPPEALDGVDADDADPIAAISRLESQFYQGNMLLRDADANGMAHGLEIRVPFLDRRLLDLVHALPGSVRLPPGAPGKHLLRQAFTPLLRPELLRQAKRGFTLPISRWMVGPLRNWCERSLAAWKDLGMLRPEAVQAVWSAFLRKPESPLWTRAFTLCVAGHYLVQTGAKA